MALALRISSVYRPSGVISYRNRGYAGAAHHAPAKAAPATPALTPAQLGQQLMAEQLKNPQPFTRERMEKMAETSSKQQLQQYIAAYKAAFPKISPTEDLANDPELSAIIRQAQDLPKAALSRDPFRDVRERFGSTIPQPKADEVPSPRFLFEVLRIAEEEGWHIVKARTLELFFETTKSLRHQHARVAARAQTDVKVSGVSVPVEMAESVPFQAYMQVVAHLQAQLESARQLVEVSSRELQAYKADVTEQKANIGNVTMADIARRHPQRAAEAFKAQEEHRWFERALEGEEDEEPAAAAHGHDAHATPAAKH